MKYFLLTFAFAATATTAAPAVAATPELYRIEARIVIAGKTVSSPRLTTLAGEKSIVKQTDAEGNDTVGLEATAQKEPAAGAEKLRVDLKFFGSRVGNSRQSLVVMPGQMTAIKFYNNNGEIVEAAIRAHPL